MVGHSSSDDLFARRLISWHLSQYPDRSCSICGEQYPWNTDLQIKYKYGWFSSSLSPLYMLSYFHRGHIALPCGTRGEEQSHVYLLKELFATTIWYYHNILYLYCQYTVAKNTYISQYAVTKRHKWLIHSFLLS